MKGKRCHRQALNDTLFCKVHQRCKGSPVSDWDPEDDSDIYNSSEDITNVNNCYAFAAGYVQPNRCKGSNNPRCETRFPQPGGTKGKANILQTAAGRRCDIVEKLIRYDIPAIKRSTFEARCPVRTSKIALVAHPGEDYHFYKFVRAKGTRKGKWVHKDGGNAAKNYDAENKEIFNPEYAARNYRPRSFLNYKDFCGFFCIPRDQPIQLQPDSEDS